MFVPSRTEPTTQACGVTDCDRRPGQADIATFEAETAGYGWVLVDLSVLGVDSLWRCPACEREVQEAE